MPRRRRRTRRPGASVSPWPRRIRPLYRPRSRRRALAARRRIRSAATVKAGEQVVGEQLADATVKRWFVPESFDGGAQEAKVEAVRDMVRTNSLEGFKTSVRALYEYDFSADLAGCKSRGEFLVGAGDGALPEGTKKLAAALGDGKGVKGVKLTVVPGAGHLPMVEQPAAVVAAAEAILGSGSDQTGPSIVRREVYKDDTNVTNA
ncbi:hypothetical protein MRB53_041443 [Persea americana]|nr:hypothetical protein MRB53_041443 [Persea americana]